MLILIMFRFCERLRNFIKTSFK